MGILAFVRSVLDEIVQNLFLAYLGQFLTDLDDFGLILKGIERSSLSAGLTRDRL